VFTSHHKQKIHCACINHLTFNETMEAHQMREACFDWFKVTMNSKYQFSNCTLQFMTMWMKQYWLDTKTLLSLQSIWALHEVREVGKAPSIKWEKQYIYQCFPLNWNKYWRNIVEPLSTVSTNTTFLQYTSHIQLLNTTHYPTVFTPIILCYGIYNNPAFSTSCPGAIFLIWSLHWQSHLT
jgi:hypothetical protein